jgi:predicted HicB family RNase H-like nuclease
MSRGLAPLDGYCAWMAASSQSERPLRESKTTSRRIKIGGRIRTFRVPDELWEEAQKVAAQCGETLSEVIRKALEEYVQEAEEQ